MCSFGALFAEILWSVERGYLPDEAAWAAFHVGFVTCICIGLLVLLATLVARNALLPPGGNRATPLRLYYVLFLFVGAGTAIGYASYVLMAPGLGGGRGIGHEEWRVFGTGVLGVMWTVSLVAVLAMATEDPGGRRVERRARGWTGAGVLVQTLFPGAARGAVFTLVVSGVALCGAGLILDALEVGFTGARTVRWGYREGGVHTLLALGGWAQLAAVACIGVLGRRLLGSAARARVVTMLMGVGVQVLAAIGVVWNLARYNELNLGLFNGSLVSVATLCMGAWMPSGVNETNLDWTIAGELVVPFPLVFALFHFIVAGVIGLVLWKVKPPSLPFDLDAPVRAPVEAPRGFGAEAGAEADTEAGAEADTDARAGAGVEGDESGTP
jgi:hypothetical protein